MKCELEEDEKDSKPTEEINVVKLKHSTCFTKNATITEIPLQSKVVEETIANDVTVGIETTPDIEHVIEVKTFINKMVFEPEQDCNICLNNNNNNNSDNRKKCELLKCQECQIVFFTMFQLRQHMRRTHDEPLKMVCEHCLKIYRSKFALWRHVCSKQPKPKDPKVFHCDICHLPFTLYHELIAHMVTHVKRM